MYDLESRLRMALDYMPHLRLTQQNAGKHAE